MNPNEFTSERAGKLIKAQSNYWAFIPNPLPMEIKYDKEMVAILSDADNLLGRLTSATREMPNPALFISPYLRKEAVLSSRIEGTQVSISDLLLFEADPKIQEETKDIKEVINYISALTWALENLPALPLSLKFIRRLHELLLTGVRGKDKRPGEFRNSQNWIGEKNCPIESATFVPPPLPEMRNSLDNWEKYIHLDDQIPALIKSAVLHYQFEAIHPFSDGNGRIGRILIIVYLIQRERLLQPNLYLSCYFEETREEYYSRLLEVSTKGLWEDWIKYFLRGIITQSKESLELAFEIIKLRESYNKRIGTQRVPVITVRLVELLFNKPYITIKNASKMLGADYQTINRAVKYLEKIGILSKFSEWRRNTIYQADELIKLIGPG
jgi:Fic family protein